MFRLSIPGRRVIPAVGLVAAAVMTLGVFYAGAATASPPTWYGCHQSSSGFKYKDSSCSGSRVVGGTYDWLELPASPQISMTMKAATPFVLKWTVSGNKMQTTCTTLTSSGYKIWNATPVGERSAEFSSGSIQLSGCTTKKPSGVECSTTISPIQTGAEQVFELEGKPVMRLRKLGATSIFQVNAEPCGLVQKPYGTGILDPTINSATSSLDFTAANTKGLAVGGAAATLEGSSKIEGATEPWVTGALRLL